MASMSRQQNQSSNTNPRSDSVDSNSSPWVPKIFIVFAVTLVAFWTLLLSTLVIHRTYTPGYDVSDNNVRLESIWSWLLLACLCWGLLNLYWSLDALRRRTLQPYLWHWILMLGCGLVVLGVQSVLITRALTVTPILIDHSGLAQSMAKGAGSASPAAVAVMGDPDKGRQVFSKTCITCHGPTGQGLPNLAPSLVGSQFIGSVDDAAVSSVIRLGRALGDSQNKSGKVMPAKGGNPFLTEEDISHLAAFVRAIQTAPIATSSDDGSPSVQLAAWVVPPAKTPASGFHMPAVTAERLGGVRQVELAAERRSDLMLLLTVGLSAVHGLFMAGLVILSSCQALPSLLGLRHPGTTWIRQLSIGGWVIATTAWFLISWLCFWWR